MKAIRFIVAAMLLFTSVGSNAQVANKAQHGKAIVQIFTNFHSGFGVVNDDRGFALDRSYLGSWHLQSQCPGYASAARTQIQYMNILPSMRRWHFATLSSD